jgi:hypothetical protein
MNERVDSTMWCGVCIADRTVHTKVWQHVDILDQQHISYLRQFAIVCPTFVFHHETQLCHI